LSKVQLTHHNLKGQGKQALKLGEGEARKLAPLTETGSGSVQDKEKARLAEIIEKVNGLFEGELTDDDQLVYVNDVIKRCWRAMSSSRSHCVPPVSYQLARSGRAFSAVDVALAGE
jgi:hypothetical protein